MGWAGFAWGWGKGGGGGIAKGKRRGMEGGIGKEGMKGSAFYCLWERKGECLGKGSVVRILDL